MNDPAVLAALISACDPIPSGPLLDVGAGDGKDAEHLRAALGRQVVTVDMKEWLGQSHVIADARDLPFDDGVFSIVYSSFLIHLVEDQGQVLGEMSRVTMPGGWVGIITLSHSQISQRHLNRYFPTMANIDMKRYPSSQSVMGMMRLNNLADVTSIRVTVRDAHPRPNYADVLGVGEWSSLLALPEQERRDGVGRALEDLERNPSARWDEEKTIILGRRWRG